MTEAVSDPEAIDLVCGECGSEYRVWKNNRVRGPGAFECQICGEQIFLWICAENVDYDFELVRSAMDASTE
jgi:DNA-directed RNA polymerase subunit RPC12/RpoP